VKGFKDLFQVKKTIEDKTSERYQLFLTVDDSKEKDSELVNYKLNLLVHKHDIIISEVQNIKNFFEKKLEEIEAVI